MTRIEAIKKAAELKVMLIKLTRPEAETSLTVWQHHFSKYPMRTRKQHPDFGLLGFIEMAEGKINHYRAVLGC